MKILVVNKFYYRRGGDCVYSMDLEKLLKAHGHEVAFYSMQYPFNEESEWKLYFRTEVSVSPKKILPFFRMFRSPFGDKNTIKTFSKLLDKFQPDIVHFNNIHTSISPIVVELAYKKGIKTVWTLHDYKLICPSYELYSCGKNCEVCIGGNKKSVLQKKCIKNNYLASWLGYKESEYWNRNRLESFTDTFICPSNFMRTKMIEDGFAAEKLVHLCNFSDFQPLSENVLRKKQYCFVGRLTRTKGIETLLKAASQLSYDLYVLGTGDLEKSLREKYENYSQIHFLGRCEKNECLSYMQQSVFTVISSEWYENNPLTIIESLCMGTPVLGARIGGIPELIQEEKTGRLFMPGDIEDLKNSIKNMMESPLKIDVYSEREKYCGEQYYKRLMKIYQREK